MNFRRNGHSVVTVLLHPTNSNNSAVALEVVGIQSNAGTTSIQSGNQQLVRVESISPNTRAGTIGFRANVRSATAATTRITATQGREVVNLTITIEAAIALPDRSTVNGAVTRLLMAEAQGPSFGGYNAVNSRRAMQWMKRVLENRLNNHPEQFSARGARTLIDIIKASGQFAGFSGYPDYNSQTRDRLQLMLNLANNDSDPRQAQFRGFIQNALDVAAAAAVTDPCPTGLYGWRTQGSGGPGGRFREYQSLAGNTFYTLTP